MTSVPLDLVSVRRPALVAACLAAFAARPAWSQQASDDRLFTAAQAAEGGRVYAASCATCHGGHLEGGSAPSLSGSRFLAEWGQPDRSLDDLFFVVRTVMPPGRARTLSAEQHASVFAYILQQNGYLAGDDPLSIASAQLRALTLRAGPGTPAEAPPRPDYFVGDSGTTPSTSGPGSEELARAADNVDDWLYATHDYTGQRYVALDRINRGNAKQLRVVCAYQFGTTTNFQTSPIVYRGVMYLTTPYLTVALDAATCQPRWKYTWESPQRDAWQNRGVAIKDGRVLRATTDGYLVALDAATGRLLWARRVADPGRGEWFTMAPLIYDDLILIGPAVSEFAIKGWVGAFRLDDGSPVWRFNIVPQRGQAGWDTWNWEAGFPVGGGGVWTPFTLDRERSLLYVATGNPAPDFPAALRGGTNLYTNSLLAIDVRTGTLAWYDQLVPEDDHDWDLTHASPIFRAKVQGTERDLIATVGKEGLLRVLDRTTHERLYEAPVTTRENTEVPVAYTGTRACPGILGGVEWSGPAYNPRTNLLYTPAVDWCTTFYAADSIRYISGTGYLGGTYEFDPTSQGWVTAVDASTGSVRWRYRSALPMLAAVTTTAGGLVFTGEVTGDFLALDAETGKVLYRFNTGGPIGGGVVTYQVAGTQYVAVMSGRPSPFWVSEHPGSATAFVLALDR